MFVFLQIPPALATNFGIFLAFRSIGGLFGGALLGIPSGAIGNLYSPSERSYAMVVWDVTTTSAQNKPSIIYQYTYRYELIYEILQLWDP